MPRTGSPAGADVLLVRADCPACGPSARQPGPVAGFPRRRCRLEGRVDTTDDTAADDVGRARLTEALGWVLRHGVRRNQPDGAGGGVLRHHVERGGVTQHSCGPTVVVVGRARRCEALGRVLGRVERRDQHSGAGGVHFGVGGGVLRRQDKRGGGWHHNNVPTVDVGGRSRRCGGAGGALKHEESRERPFGAGAGVLRRQA